MGQLGIGSVGSGEFLSRIHSSGRSVTSFSDEYYT